jgi:fructose-specific component phosphotransferase system IIB-like protein
MADQNAKPKQPEYDAGHVPMTEEMDDARHSLPNMVPVVIALAVVAVIVAAAAYLLRAKPVAGGNITGVYAVEQTTQATSFVAINVALHNTSEKTIYIKDIKAEITTPAGTFSDDAANAADYERYLTAYPDLRQAVKEPLKVETKIPSGGNAEGTVLVNYPINKDNFDKRTAVTVTIIPYDNASIVIRGK